MRKVKDHHKTDRQNHIRKILTENFVENQISLVKLLRESGIMVTQSSASRDLSDLGIVKVEGRYILPSNRISGVLSIQAAGSNLLVVKTEVGAASHVGMKLDQLKNLEIVGTVAGDDTIFIATLGRAGQVEIAGLVGVVLK